MNRKLPKSQRKYIRLEKGRIRREFGGDAQSQQEALAKVYQKMGLEIQAVDKGGIQKA
ncbi:MAG: hypothetical protein PHN39_01135 [Candidatus Pacebacteria bacterium]|nr:hypothetical protein [Candidatus Paceibacterota bacterium]